MKQFNLKVHFITPAFMGNALQKGELRTPPFKALLRKWWRIVKANRLIKAGVSPDGVHEEIRRAEGKLFGHAWLENGKKWAMRSKVFLRLERWREGETIDLPKTRFVCHNEVDLSRIRDREKYFCKEHNAHHLIDPLLYLGYGPIGKTVRIAIKEGTQAKLTILLRDVSDEEYEELKDTLSLINLLGTIGGRSRNGWGSIWFESDSETHKLSSFLDPENECGREWIYKYARELEDCLSLDWCHAIGMHEGKLLLWRSKGVFARWDEAIRFLAQIKIELRTNFRFGLKQGKYHSNLCERHILAYPVTNHPLFSWEFKRENGKKVKEGSRLSNQIIFKVHKTTNGYIPIIVHLPHGLPKVLVNRLNKADKEKLAHIEKEVWVKAINIFNNLLADKLQRLC